MGKKHPIALTEVIEQWLPVTYGHEPVFGAFTVAKPLIFTFLAPAWKRCLQTAESLLLHAIHQFVQWLRKYVTKSVSGKHEMVA